MQFFMPTELITGEHCVTENAKKLARYGKRCLIVTGGSAAARSGALQDAEDALCSQGISFTHYAGIEPNPTLASCQEGGRLAHEAGAEFVLGIGGGSPLDAAKAVSVFAANPGMTEEVFYSANICLSPDRLRREKAQHPRPAGLCRAGHGGCALHHDTAEGRDALHRDRRDLPLH